MNTRPLAIVTAPRRDSRHWVPSSVTFDDIVEWMLHPSDVKEAGNYLLGTLEPSTVDHTDRTGCTAIHRRKGAVVSRSAITMDVDYADPSVPPRFLLELMDYAGVMHTTFSSTPEEPRLRIILMTDRDLFPDEYAMCVSVLMEELGKSHFDPGSNQPERYMFKPAARRPEDFQHWVLDGDPLVVDEVLARFDPETLPKPKVHQNKRNPFELAGVVGAFNRAYDLDGVIEHYDVPYVRIGEDRYKLAGASSAPGMGPIAGADGLYYSHHANDPAGGQTCSAFDLVRLHRFAHLDEDVDDKTPVNRRPSHEAMLELAAQDPRVISEMVGLDFAADMTEEAGGDWKLHLRLASRTGKLIDSADNWELILAHDPVLSSLYYNELTFAVEADKDLPWRSIDRAPGATFIAADLTSLAFYIEKEYKFRPTKTFADDLVAVAAQRRRVNPLREYLESLVWDGVPRVEEALPGVEPTEYTRLVARKAIVAAAARMLDPGVKWDHTLVLYGLEGLGKSWWINKLARGYSASLGRIDNKDTLLTMQRSWIMVADEGFSLKKADSDALKEFLTRTHDVFRLPYERETMSHPRHSVIWATTNDEVFLRRQEGNRRFLIVRCEQPVDFNAVSDEYVDQVWAEAVHLYRNGEQLYLRGSEGELAAAEREQFTEEDALGGVLEAYLDTPVPADWDSMSSESRVLWMRNYRDGVVDDAVAPQTVTCSAQLWVEALGRRFGDHKRTDLLEITAALKRMPNWRATERRRVPQYGPQLVFERIDEEDDLI